MNSKHIQADLTPTQHNSLKMSCSSWYTKYIRFLWQTFSINFVMLFWILDCLINIINTYYTYKNTYKSMIKEIQHYQEIIKHLDLFARYFWRGYSLYPLPNSLSLMSTFLKPLFPESYLKIFLTPAIKQMLRMILFKIRRCFCA